MPSASIPTRAARPHSVDRRLSKAVVLVLLLIGLPRATAKPCPSNAFFLYSQHHKSSVCACARGLVCVGSSCIRGHADNYGTFSHPESEGFKPSCDDCSCDDFQGAPPASFVRADLITGGSMRDFKDPVFDARCQAEPGPRQPPRALARLNWLHFPKCGSSFTNTLYQYACRGGKDLYKFTDILDPHFADYQKDVCRVCWEACGNHCEGGFTLWSPADGLMRIRSRKSRIEGEIIVEEPFYEKYCAAEIIGHIPGHFPLKDLAQRSGTVAAMFRDPRRRLVSAFNHHRHAFGMNGAVSEQMRATTHTVEAYANFPGIQNCMTKMLLGITCGHMVKLTEEDVTEAIRRIHEDLAFVGIVEYWDQSICLFHRMFGGAIDESELKNLRPGEYGEEETTHTPEEAIRHSWAFRNLPPPVDADEALREGHPVDYSLLMGSDGVPRPQTQGGLTLAGPHEWKQLSKWHDPLDWVRPGEAWVETARVEARKSVNHAIVLCQHSTPSVYRTAFNPTIPGNLSGLAQRFC